MTDNTQDATENVQPEQIEQAEQADAPAPIEPAHDEQPTEKGNREAAKYRRQLRDTEQQLNQTQTALQAAREEALRYAALKHRFGETASEHANSPTIIEAALQELTFDTDKLYTPEGNINQDALREELENLLESKPYYFQHRIGAYVAGEGKTPSGDGPSHGFTEAFRPER